MLKYIQEIPDLPSGVRKSIYFTIAAWVGHWLFLFIYLQNSPGDFPQNLYYKHLGMGLIICVFLVLQKPWAKWLGAMGNIIVILYYLFLIAIVYASRKMDAMMMVDGTKKPEPLSSISNNWYSPSP